MNHLLLTLTFSLALGADGEPKKAAVAKSSPSAPVPASTNSAASKEAKPRGPVKITPDLQYDLEKKQVTVDAEVVFREGPLELLLCPRRTKEHESILAATFPPRALQFALLIIGAKPGSPAQFEPYKPPTGQKIKIWLEYEKDGQPQRVDAREWIRDVKTGKQMAADFVFAGSRLQKVPGAERPVFLADDGDAICLANFAGSLIDVAMKASKKNDELSFEAWTDRIPPKGTKVRLVLVPQPQ